MKVCNFTVSFLNIHEQYYLSWAMWLAAAMQSQSLPNFQEPRSRLLMIWYDPDTMIWHVMIGT